MFSFKYSNYKICIIVKFKVHPQELSHFKYPMNSSSCFCHPWPYTLQCYPLFSNQKWLIAFFLRAPKPRKNHRKKPYCHPTFPYTNITRKSWKALFFAVPRLKIWAKTFLAFFLESSYINNSGIQKRAEEELFIASLHELCKISSFFAPSPNSTYFFFQLRSFPKTTSKLNNLINFPSPPLRNNRVLHLSKFLSSLCKKKGIREKKIRVHALHLHNTS